MELVGHRGCPAHGPENTARSVAAADGRADRATVRGLADRGVDGVTTDSWDRSVP